MEKKPPLERINWFVAELKKGSNPNAPRLAQKFEVSLPTAYRDIEFLRDRLKAPIRYDPQEKGFVLENQGFELPSVWISDEELLMLALARELFLDPDAKAILHELVKKVSHCASPDLDRITRSITYKGTGHYPLKEGVLNRIIEAILKKRQIEILYCHVFTPGRAPTWNKLSPRHLLFYRGNWYLLADLGHSLRTYALSRMEEVRLLEEPFTDTHPDGEIRKKIESAFGIFVTDQGQPPQKVRLQFAPEIAGFIRRTVFHPDQKVESLADGSIILSFPSTINRELIGEVLSFVNEVKVLEPDSLRREIRRILKEALAGSGKSKNHRLTEKPKSE